MRDNTAVGAGSIGASRAMAAQASQQTQGTQAYEAQRPPVFDRLGTTPNDRNVGSSRAFAWASGSVAWNPCYFAAARACRGEKFLGKDGLPVRDCPMLLAENCPRPHDRQTCQAVWTNNADFRSRLDNYVKVVERNNHRVPSKEQLQRAGVVPNWRNKTASKSRVQAGAQSRQQQERPRFVDPSRAVTPFRDRSSSTIDRRGAVYMAVLKDDNAPLEGASYRSSAVGVAQGASTDSMYRLDLSTGRLTEIEVEAPEEAVVAAAEHLAGAMLQGAGVFMTEQQRDAALDAAPEELLRLATSLEAAGDEQSGARSEGEEPIVISDDSSDGSDLPVYPCTKCDETRGAQLGM